MFAKYRQSSGPQTPSAVVVIEEEPPREPFEEPLCLCVDAAWTYWQDIYGGWHCAACDYPQRMLLVKRFVTIWGRGVCWPTWERPEPGEPLDAIDHPKLLAIARRRERGCHATTGATHGRQ